MDDVLVCVMISNEHPETLDFELTKDDKSNNDIVKVVIETQATAAKQSDHLDQFQLVPKDADGKPKLSGLDLFDHICWFCNAQVAQETKT